MYTDDRITLPCNADFGLGDVELLNHPDDFPVSEDTLPGKSDDELRFEAEENGRWELYDTHGLDQEKLSYGALYNRFMDTYRGDIVDAPGAFINSVLRMQRQLPNAREYADGLAAQGLYSRQDAAALPDVTSVAELDRDSDEARAHHKLWYMANAVVPDLRNPDAAAKYASEAMRAAADNNDKARGKAHDLLLAGRGIDESAIEDSTVETSAQLDRGVLLRLGVPAEIVDEIDAAPQPHPIYPNFPRADRSVRSALSDPSLDKQIALRQFFGAKNLARLVVSDVVLEQAISENNLAFTQKVIGMGLAGTHLVETNVRHGEQFESAFTDSGVAERLNMSEERLSQLGALTMFALREPGLSGRQDGVRIKSDLLGRHSNTVNFAATDYRIWLDRQIAQGRSANRSMT